MYQLELSKESSKFIRKLDGVTRKRVTNALFEIAENPIKASNVKRLSGLNAFRKRVGDIRIIYEVHDEQLMIYVLKIGNRGDVYDKL